MKISRTDSILEVSGLGNLPNITRCMREHEATQRNHGELEKLNELKDYQEATQSEVNPAVSTSGWRSKRQFTEARSTNLM